MAHLETLDTYYNDLDIDLADIWGFEVTIYKHYHQQERGQMDFLYNYLQNIFLACGQSPWLSKSLVDSGKFNQSYYEKYDMEYRDYLEDVSNNRNENNLITFFKYKECFYNMTDSCLVRRTEKNKIDFQLLFAYKLKHYQYALEVIEQFLARQMSVNFNNDIRRFKKFLTLLLLQQKDIIPTDVAGQVHLWSLELKEMTTQNIFPTSEEKLGHDSPISEKEGRPNLIDENRATEDMTSLPPTPSSKDPAKVNQEGYSDLKTNQTESDSQYIGGTHNLSGNIVLNGNFNLEETLGYFSFLYKEKSIGGKSYLSEEDVKTLFKEGIFIPQSPPINKYKLNVAQRYPMVDVLYAFYIFYLYHAHHEEGKAGVLRFLVYNFTNFKKGAGDLEQTIKKLSKNFKSSPGKKMKFDPYTYIPENVLKLSHTAHQQK